ncbi:hypothetical protein Tco_0627441 [Tanacetum coccineum]|uniref:Uncharacterized protein n=1 Tax=Tanacetum coccineum TaxID=301880 RepID=A0ABQ4WMG5_9ASTR
MYKSGSRQNLGVAGITTVRNGWLRRRKRDHLAKVRCFLIQSGLSKVLWAEDTTMSTYLVNKVVLYRNMGFNERRKLSLVLHIGTGSMQVLQGDEFEVEPQDGHTFEEATLCKGKLFSIRSSYVAAFAVAAVE